MAAIGAQVAHLDLPRPAARACGQPQHRAARQAILWRYRRHRPRLSSPARATASASRSVNSACRSERTSRNSCLRTCRLVGLPEHICLPHCSWRTLLAFAIPGGRALPVCALLSGLQLARAATAARFRRDALSSAARCRRPARWVSCTRNTDWRSICDAWTRLRECEREPDKQYKQAVRVRVCIRILN